MQKKMWRSELFDIINNLGLIKNRIKKIKIGLKIRQDCTNATMESYYG